MENNEEREFWNTMRRDDFSMIEKVQEFIDEQDKDFVKLTRKRYLKEEVPRLEEEIKQIIERSNTWKGLMIGPVNFEEVYLSLSGLNKKAGRLRRMQNELRWLTQKKDGKWLSPEDIERANQVDIIEAGLLPEARRMGAKVVMRCLWHEEDRASLTIYPDGRGFYCFGCQKSGTAITLYMKIHNVPFLQAVRELLNIT